MPLGRDIDIAFVAVGSTLDRVIQTKTGDDIETEMKMTPVLTEFTRVRVSPLSAVSMAMNILEQMIGNGAANKAAIQAAIETFQEPPEPKSTESASDLSDFEELLNDA